jgi:hypothetical protein
MSASDIMDKLLQDRIDRLKKQITTLYGGPQILKEKWVVDRVAAVETMRLRGLVAAYEGVIVEYYQ